SPEKIMDRLDKHLRFKDKRIHRYVKKEMAKGAVIGATFATLGYLIRDFFHDFQGVKSSYNSVKSGEFIPQSVKDSVEEIFTDTPQEIGDRSRQFIDAFVQQN